MVHHYGPAYDEVTAMTTMLSQFRASKRSAVRKKFSKPPVKLACLSCRASRIRCDGQELCSNCASKGRKCSYLPSKRGRSKKSNLSTLPKKRASQDVTPGSIATSPVGFPDHHYMSPQKGTGSGSVSFQPDVQTMFADLLDPYDPTNCEPKLYNPPQHPATVALQPVVRIYAGEQEILDAYYQFIHPYFPILPARTTCASPDYPLGAAAFAHTTSFELPYRPQSPLSLAISAILALVPHPEDLDPSSETSMVWRRTYSHTFAQMANLSIEADCERDALNKSPLTSRQPFHPGLPMDLEKILALLVLSVYEYTQRGNLTKMRYRAGQALTMALDMSLHSLGEDRGKYAEAQRRAWWMTYYCVLQGSIVSESSPSIVVNDSDFVTPYPQFSADPDGWSILIQAQQALALADQFTADLNRCLSAGSNIPYIYHRMKGLDDTINTMLAQSQMLPVASPTADIDDRTECATALSIRAMSRIKLFSAQIKVHQSQAFLDNPIFARRQYELSAYQPSGQMCTAYPSGDGFWEAESFGSDMSQSQVSSPVSSSWSSFSSSYGDYQPPPMQTELPFSVKYSARVCLRAALAMSQMVQVLPNPTSLYAFASPSMGAMGSNTITQFPLAMPSFACCLTQGSYIMSTICYKARMAQRVSPEMEPSACGSVTASDQLVEELKKGLQFIVAAMGNHAVAFEALRGIRDEIECAYQRAFPDA